MDNSAPESPAPVDRRTLIRAAAWSVPVVAATSAIPLAAASTTSAGDFSVSVTNRVSAPAGYRAEFWIIPEHASMPVPTGTTLFLEATQVHSRSWTVVSSYFSYLSTVSLDGNGEPTSDPVNAVYSGSTYATAIPFTAAMSIGLYFVPYRNQTWGVRVSAALPAGWSAGPGAITIAETGPLYE